MGNSYTRQSSATIQNDLPINANDLNAEFNSLQDAFDGALGHSHDGTTGEGQKIPLNTSVTGTLPLANGGTAGTDAASARTNLGLGSLATKSTVADADITGPISVGKGGTGQTTTAGIKTSLALVKADVGLGNVDNTSDANKPVSTAQATAIAAKLTKSGDTLTGPLTSMVVDHSATSGTETFDYSQGNTHQITVNGALTINPTNLVAGGTLTIDILYSSGSIAVSGTTYWELGSTLKSTNIADVNASLVAGNPYRIVFKLVKGLRTGVFQ